MWFHLASLFTKHHIAGVTSGLAVVAGSWPMWGRRMCTKTFGGFGSYVNMVEFSPDGSMLAALPCDGSHGIHGSFHVVMGFG